MSLENLTPEEIDELNKKHWAETEKEFEQFKTDLAKGMCWVCKEPLNSFDESRPCQHWLLKPDGFRKKHFKKLFEAKTIDKIEGFLRWYVNAHEPVKNINNLKEEHDADKLKALTIKHQNLEWSFSLAKSCFEGTHGIHGSHYHFQMRVDDRPFHDYGDRHIKLSDYEKWMIDIELGNNPKIKRLERYGAGMQDVLDNIEPESLLESMRSTDDYENAQFNVSSLVMADEGQMISGDDMADLIEEHNRTGMPMHQLVKKLKNVTTTIIVEPGGGVPIAAQRTKRNRNKKKH